MPSPNQSNRQAKSETSEVADELSLLREEIRVLRDSIDEFREVFEWAAQNFRSPSAANELGNLQFPSHAGAVEIPHVPTSPAEIVVDQAAEEVKTVDDEIDKYDQNRISYLIRIMPKQEKFDQIKHYYCNLRDFYDTYKQELPYLNARSLSGSLGAEAESSYWEQLYMPYIRLVEFEKTDEAFWSKHAR